MLQDRLILCEEDCSILTSEFLVLCDSYFRIIQIPEKDDVIHAQYLSHVWCWICLIHAQCRFQLHWRETLRRKMRLFISTLLTHTFVYDPGLRITLWTGK